MKRRQTIHFVHHDSEKSGIGRITTVARLENSAGTPGKSMRKLGCYALVYVYSGSGVYRDSQLTRDVRAGDLILLGPDRNHAYKPTGEVAWNEYFMLFEGPVFDLWQQQGWLPPECPILNLQPCDLWIERIKGIYQPEQSPLQQIARLQGFLADALAHDRYQVEKEATQRWLDRAHHFLEQHLTRTDAVHRAARDMGQSYETFRKKYRRLTDRSPRYFSSKKRMELAAQHLVETSAPVQEIAEKLGFCDQFYFSKRFKMFTGVTPAKYRKRLYRLDDS